MEEQILSISSLSAGVDYITVTSRGERNRAELWRHGKLLIAEEQDGGNKKIPWTFHGIRGIQCGMISIGDYRDDYTCVMLKSALAASHWKRVYDFAENVTRLDMQVTMVLGSSHVDLAQEYYDAIKSDAGDLYKKRKYTIIATVKGGDTLYVGARTSVFFGRVYDKSAQQGLRAGQAWRYELEIKKPAAIQMAHKLRPLEYGDQQGIAATVYQWFDDRGVTPRFAIDTPGITIELARPPTSDDKTLEWLRSQIGPKVRDLIDRGKISECSDALGIQIIGLNFKQLQLMIGKEK